MNNLFLPLKLILFNFKNSPKQALSKSYSLVNSKEVSLFSLLILALLSGISNILIIKFIPLSLLNLFDKTLEKYNIADFEKYFGSIYTPNLVKCFFLGIIIFLILFCINSIIFYILKTNLFKTKLGFDEILNKCWLPLIPPVVFTFIAAICSIFSILLYLLFLVLGILTFLIYQYEHLSNTVSLSKDRLCFICSITAVIFIIILLKLNSSPTFNVNSTNNMNELFKNSLFNSL